MTKVRRFGARSCLIAAVVAVVCLLGWRTGDNHIMSVASGFRLTLKAAENLALGQEVSFRPAPNYSLTSVGDTDSNDLTDGRVSVSRGAKIWYDAASVGFWGVPYVEATIPLKSWSNVGRVAVRLLGGADQPGLSFPREVILYAQDARGHRQLIDKYSASVAADQARFMIPTEQGQAWVHTLSFAEGSFLTDEIVVAIRGSRLTVMDEIIVEGNETDDPRPTGMSLSADGYSPIVHFHKGRLVVTDVPSPVPVGAVEEVDSAVVDIQLPLSIYLDRVVTGDRFSVSSVDSQPSDTAGARFYSFTLSNCSGPTCGWLYLRAADVLPDEAVIGMRTRKNGLVSDWQQTPVRYISTKPIVEQSDLMFTLGWYPLQNFSAWPNPIESMDRFGINTISVFGEPWPERRDVASIEVLEKARSFGFDVLMLTSPFEKLRREGKNHPEVFCQIDGSAELCPSYRGREFERMLHRFMTDVTEFKPDYVVTDIENWSYRGPTQVTSCERCKKSFSDSSYDSREAWLREQGSDMYTKLAASARGDNVSISSYDFRPGLGYQKTWYFDDLYPDVVDFATPSYYSTFDPYGVERLGAVVRHDANLSGAEVMPWISAGYAGSFTMEQAEAALMEVFVNGGRGGLWFSHEYLDTEAMLAMNHVRAALTGFEQTVLYGRTDDLDCRPLRCVVRSYEGKSIGLISNASSEPVETTIRLNVETESIVQVAGHEILLAVRAPEFPVQVAPGGYERFLVYPGDSPSE